MPGESTRPPQTNQASCSPSHSDLAVHALQSSTSDSSYCKYLLVKIGEVAGVALIDSGNTWRSIISRQFAIKLGLNLNSDIVRVKDVDSLGTAKEGADLAILGEPNRNLYIRLGNSATKFKFKPIIVDGMTMHVNIAGPFLKRHHIDQVHSRDCILVQGQEVKLYPELSDPCGLEVTEGNIINPKETILPPYSVNHIEMQIPAIKEGKMIADSGSVRGNLDFMAKYDCHPLSLIHI